MALLSYAPARRSYAVPSDVNRLFGSLFDTPTTARVGAVQQWVPAIDLIETEADYVVKADIPGLSQEQIGIEVKDEVLTISGERASEHREQKGGYYRLERASGSFRRSLRLPQGVDPAAITASFTNGVLEVHVPKPEERKPQKVAITVGGAQPVIEES